MSKFALGFTLQIYFSFFNVERIRGFTSNFVAINSLTSHPFGYPSRSKYLPLEILKLLVTKLRNQDKKFALIQVDEDGALERSSEFITKCHNMNILGQNTVGYTSSLNGKRKITNKKLDNITRDLLLKSIHKKEIWCLAY